MTNRQTDSQKERKTDGEKNCSFGNRDLKNTCIYKKQKIVLFCDI